MSPRSNFERLAVVRQLASSGEARRRRQDAQATLSEIAEEVGVLPGTVWKWEVGRLRPNGEPALKYLRVLERLAALTGTAA
jgi:DNA-binding transcriptional regulator YiaG